jgi:hypothetical protein
MRNKIGNRIVLLGQINSRKKILSQRQSLSSSRAGGYRTVIIKDGEFVQRRARR